MDERNVYLLTLRETDIDGAMRRFCGNEELYLACLGSFLGDPTMTDLNLAVTDKRWDDAFTAAHALKGLAGNMGFVPLMHSVGRLVILIRGGRISDVDAALNDVNSCYRDITDAIRQLMRTN